MFTFAGSVRQADRENCVPQGALTEFLQDGQHPECQTGETASISKPKRKKLEQVRKAKVRKSKDSN